MILQWFCYEKEAIMQEVIKDNPEILKFFKTFLKNLLTLYHNCDTVKITKGRRFFI